MKERYKKEIEEVMDEISSALADSRGIEVHKIRLGSTLSVGVVSIIESYLDKEKVLKSGGKIDHRWLKKKKENAKELISNQIICPVENLDKLDEILNIAYK